MFGIYKKSKRERDNIYIILIGYPKDISLYKKKFIEMVNVLYFNS